MTARRLRTALATVILGLAIAACGGSGDGGGGGGGGGASAGPAQTQVTIDATTNAPFALQAGRYRFSWDAPECTKVDFVLTGQGSGFVYEKDSNLPKFTSIASNLPDDTFALAQNEATCAAWSVTMDRIGS